MAWIVLRNPDSASDGGQEPLQPTVRHADSGPQSSQSAAQPDGNGMQIHCSYSQLSELKTQLRNADANSKLRVETDIKRWTEACRPPAKPMPPECFSYTAAFEPVKELARRQDGLLASGALTQAHADRELQELEAEIRRKCNMNRKDEL